MSMDCCVCFLRGIAVKTIQNLKSELRRVFILLYISNQFKVFGDVLGIGEAGVQENLKI